MEDFEERLTGGHPNSPGRTIEVVDLVLAEPDRFGALFDCYESEDAVVRLRVSNAMKRICRARPELLVPYIDRFIVEIAPSIRHPRNGRWRSFSTFCRVI